MPRWIFLISLLFLQTACDAPNDIERPGAPLLNNAAEQTINKTTSAPVFEPLEPTNLLNEPTPVHVFESTAEALTIWRQGAQEKPTLLLLSNNPHLTPVPKELRRAAVILVNNAKPEDIQLASTDRNPSTLILPGMATDIALRSDWFREIAWALPLRDPTVVLDLQKFKDQLINAGIASEVELETFTLNEQILNGSLRGVPMRAAALPLIKDLDGPVIVHIDLSYFQPIYKNEIATPLLDIIFQTIQTLKKMRLETLAVTFAYGHRDSQIALDVRFLGEIISYLIEDPLRLDKDIPLNWQRQRDALYLANFFQKDKIRELHEAQEKDEPESAYIKFNLYRSAAEHKEGAKALDYLAQAVKLDPMYALEYLDLSNMAYEKKRPDQALRMLKLAAEVFQEDPFLKIQMAQLASELGQKEMSLKLVEALRDLEWSTIYYPQMQQYLLELTAFIQGDPTSSQIGQEPGGDLAPDSMGQGPDRQRIIHAQ